MGHNKRRHPVAGLLGERLPGARRHKGDSPTKGTSPLMDNFSFGANGTLIPRLGGGGQPAFPSAPPGVPFTPQGFAPPGLPGPGFGAGRFMQGGLMPWDYQVPTPTYEWPFTPVDFAALLAPPPSPAAAPAPQPRRDITNTGDGQAGQGGGGEGGPDGGGGGGGGGCFAPGTAVEMADGSTKPVEDIRVGDKTRGGEVTTTMIFSATCPIFEYRGVVVSGSHAVFENGKWKRVADADYAQLLEKDKAAKIEQVFVFDTTEHRIFTNGIAFADYSEVGDDSQACSAIDAILLGDLQAQDDADAFSNVA